MSEIVARRAQRITSCGVCGSSCRSDWIETVDGVEWLTPRCSLHKKGARERQVAYVRKYERTHGVNDRVYSFTDKEGNVVTCKKAYWYRARRLGKFHEGQEAA